MAQPSSQTVMTMRVYGRNMTVISTLALQAVVRNRHPAGYGLLRNHGGQPHKQSHDLADRIYISAVAPAGDKNRLFGTASSRSDHGQYNKRPIDLSFIALHNGFNSQPSHDGLYQEPRALVSRWPVAVAKPAHGLDRGQRRRRRVQLTAQIPDIQLHLSERNTVGVSPHELRAAARGSVPGLDGE